MSEHALAAARSAEEPVAGLVELSAAATSRVKNAVDRLLALIMLLLLAPVVTAVAVAVLIKSGGPIIHRRRVLGLHGIPFNAFKFRTMVNGADELLAAAPPLAQQFRGNMKLRDDPRLTPIGGVLRRSSLDELPQLINVLRGEMSLVGPRMIAPEELSKFGSHSGKRLTVKPGITGLWQVSGRQELDYERRVELDLQYIDTWSLKLDAVILLRTIPTVLSMRGAF